MASARQSALYERRTQYRSPFSSESRKVLAPASTGISSIAKQSAANETDIMIAKYNAGQIGNEEIKAFLQAQLNNQYVSASDKTQIQTKLLDFDVLIEKDRLESVFKQAPENSLQKIQAATALADFYNRRASTMVAGTQAHSQALENAGAWQAQVASIQESTNKVQQKNYKNQMLAAVNAIPDGSGKAQAAAEMYGKLYELAMQQGDQESAQVYEANRQTELQNVIAYQESEANKTDRQLRKDTIDDMAEKKMLYESGQITKDDYYKYLDDVNIYATQNEDGTLQNTIFNEVTRVEKNISKGKGPGVANNVYGSLRAKVRTNGQGGVVTGYDDLLWKNYEQMRQVNEEFKKTGDAATYITRIENMIQDKAKILGQQRSEYAAIAANDSNADVYVNGRKTDVTTALKEIDKDLTDLEVQVNDIANGNFIALTVQPKSEGEGAKSVPDIKYVSLENAKKDPNLIVDSSGKMAHEIQFTEAPITEYPGITADMINQAMLTGQFYDPNTGQFIKYNSKTKTYSDPNQRYVRYYDENRGIEYKEPITKEGTVRSFSDMMKALEDEQFANESVVKPVATQSAAINPTKDMSLVQKIRETANNILPNKVISPIPTEAKPVGQQLQEKIIQPAVESIGEGLQNINTNVVQPTIKKVASNPTVQSVARVVTSPKIENAPIPYVANKVAQTAKPIVNNIQQIGTKAASTPLSQPVQQVVNSGPIGTILKASLGVQSAVKNAASSAWNWLTKKR